MATLLLLSSLWLMTWMASIPLVRLCRKSLTEMLVAMQLLWTIPTVMTAWVLLRLI